MSVYRRIRDLREDADRTQKQIADELSMHLTQYRRYESGESELPTDVAIELANLYHVSLDYLTGRSSRKNGLNASDLTSAERLLLEGFRGLSGANRGRLLERLELLLDRQTGKDYDE